MKNVFFYVKSIFLVYNRNGDNMNKKIIIIVSVISATIIVGISIFLYSKHINSTNYKLKKLGYNVDEINILIKDERYIDIALKEYNDSLTKFITSKYFMLNRLNRYIEYHKNNNQIDISRIVSIVNANMDKEIYTDVKTVFQDDELVLVNKFHKLESSAVINDLKEISIQYAYDGHKLKEEAALAYIKMAKSAKKENITLIANVSYRSYQDQENAYNNYKSKYGITKADLLAARAGHSEHQTGLALNITTRLSGKEFIDTEAYNWLKNNAHKFGFILRYPEGKEDITGFSFEPEHFRYVGIDVATKIYEEDITFDEYYAYYIENSIKWGRYEEVINITNMHYIVYWLQ